MRNIKIATVQFENKSGDKEYNLSVIDRLSEKAAEEGADAIAFHECSITGYSFARKLSHEQMLELSERIPDGWSTRRLQSIAENSDIAIRDGVFEKDDRGDIYKASVCVDKTGLLAKHRKLHPFPNKNIRPGTEYTVFQFCGWKDG